MPADRQPLWNTRDWWEGLIWPRVARAPLLGLRPSRVLTALFALLIVALIFAAGHGVDNALLKSAAWPAFWINADPQSPAPSLHPHWSRLVNWPLEALMVRPITVLIALPSALVIGLVAVASICRGVGLELADGRVASWPSTIGFAAARWKSLLAAALAPFAAIWGIAIGIGLFGLLFRVPGLDLVAAVAYGLVLIAGFAATILSAAAVLGIGLTTPAVVIDDADTIGAFERATAYALGSPLRLLLYLASASITIVAAGGLFYAVVVGGSAFAARSVQTMAGERGNTTAWLGTLDALQMPSPAQALLRQPDADPQQRTVADLAASQRTAARIVRLWVSLAFGVVYAAGISLSAAGLTAVYLGLRRAVDGQDFADVDGPEQIRRSMARALAARQSAAGPMRAPTPLGTEHEE